MEDAEIIALYWARDEQAVDAAYQKYSRYLRTIALNVLDSYEDAEECVNDAMLGAWEAIPPARPEVLSAFLGRIAKNIALNKVRNDGRKKRGGESTQLPFEELSEFLADGASVEEQAESGELGGAVNRFLGELPEEQRKVFVCRYWYGDAVGDIARRLGFTEGKVKMILLRQRKALRDRLTKEGFLK